MHKLSTGMWIFLSALLVVVAVVGIFAYNENLRVQGEKAAAVKQQKKERQKQQDEYVESLKAGDSCRVVSENPYKQECTLN